MDFSHLDVNQRKNWHVHNYLAHLWCPSVIATWNNWIRKSKDYVYVIGITNYLA